MQITSRPHQKFFDKKMVLLLGFIIGLDILMMIFGPPASLDIKLYYSGEEALALFQSFSSADKKSYFINELFDLFLLLSYTAALSLGLQRIYSRRFWTIALPIIVGACDFIETIVIISVLKFSVSQSVFDWLGVFSCIKWSLGGVLIILLLVGSVLKKHQ
jgi:hypothetical protein